MKYHLHLPPTGLLFSSLAMLSLRVVATETQKQASSTKAADNTAKKEREKPRAF